MESRSRKLDDTEPDPMLPEQFEIALAATQIRTPELIEACRAILVDDVPGPEIAEKYSIELPHIYRATGSIRQSWDRICATEEWDYIPLAVPRSLANVVMAFQRELLKSYSDKKSKRRRRRKS